MRVGLWGPLGKGVFLFWESAVVSGVSCVALWGHWVYVCVYACAMRWGASGSLVVAFVRQVCHMWGGRAAGVRILVLLALGRVLLASD